MFRNFLSESPIVRPPITSPDSFTGFFIEKSFCRAPLFTKIGLPTTELERRALRDLIEELSYIRNLGFIYISHILPIKHKTLHPDEHKQFIM
jgi:hypothetical protein